MFGSKTYHICSVHEETSRSFLPVLPPIASNFQKLKRFCKQLILVTEVNPQSIIFYKNSERVVEERKKQVDLGSWIIHPFSTLRLYYEMWMTFGFFINFIIIPLDASYAYLLDDYDIYLLDNLCNVITWIDILMNFRTGVVYTNEDILMKQSKIARAYILSPYFLVDVLSSLTILCDDNHVKSCSIISYFGMLKILRLPTFLSYLERSLTYFKIEGFKDLFIKVVLVSMIMIHYFSCAMFFSTWLFYSWDEDKSTAKATFMSQERIKRSGGTDVDYTIRVYIKNFYEASSFLMGIQTFFRPGKSWVNYLSGIMMLITGRILTTFVTVIMIDIFKNKDYLEIKYQAMMSQIDSFMTVHKFPLGLQTKIRQFYLYKYRERYLNEAKLEQYLSEKLKKEIRFHDCRKLVQNVHLFEQFPQTILEDILSLLKFELYMANDCIIRAGTVGDCMYFLSLGTVAVFSPTGKEICHLSDGDYFGEFCLLVSKAKRSASVIALEICEVYKMDRKLFRKCFETQPALMKELQIEAKRRFVETKEIESTFINLTRSPTL